MNQQIQNDVVTINVNELWYVLLFHWRRVLIFILVGIFIGEGAATFKYKRNIPLRDTYQNEERQYEKQKKQYEQLIKSKKKNLSDYLDYYNHSLIMQVDPQNEQRTYGILSVTPVAGINLADATSAVNNAIMSDEFLRRLAKNNGTKLAYIKEVITDSADESGNYFVSVIGKENSFTQKIYKQIQNEVKKISEKNSAVYVCQLADPTNDVVSNTDLASRQTAYQAQINNTNTDIANTQTALDNLTVPTAPDGKKELAIKYGIMGAIVGLLIALIENVILFNKNSAVFNESDIKGEVSNRTLGDFDQSQLDHFDNHGMQGFARKRLGLVNNENIDRSCLMVATNLIVFMNSDQRHIIFIGKDDEINRLKRIFPAIHEKLKEMGKEYQFAYTRNILTSPEARRVVKNSDGAVIVIYKGNTDINTVQKEIALLKNMQVECIGAIYL